MSAVVVSGMICFVLGLLTVKWFVASELNAASDPMRELERLEAPDWI